jgi:chromosome segregation ATPase
MKVDIQALKGSISYIKQAIDILSTENENLESSVKSITEDRNKYLQQVRCLEEEVDVLTNKVKILGTARTGTSRQNSIIREAHLKLLKTINPRYELVDVEDAIKAVLHNIEVIRNLKDSLNKFTSAAWENKSKISNLERENSILLNRTEIAERNANFYRKKLIEINQETSKLFES